MPALSSPAPDRPDLLLDAHPVSLPVDVPARLADALGLGGRPDQPLTLPVLVGSDALRLPLVAWAEARGALPVHVREVIVLTRPLEPGADFHLSASLNELGPAAELTAILKDARSGDIVARHEARVVGSSQLTPTSSGRQAAAPPDADAVALGAVTEALIARYAAVSGDDNPVHLDAAAARALGLPGPIAHGMCLMGMMQQALEPVAYPCRFEAQFVGPAPLGTPLFLSRAERDSPAGPVTRLRLADGDGRNMVLGAYRSGEGADA